MLLVFFWNYINLERNDNLAILCFLFHEQSISFDLFKSFKIYLINVFYFHNKVIHIKLFGLIPRCFMFYFYAVINYENFHIYFNIFKCSVLIHKNIIDFCKLTIYPVTFLSSFTIYSRYFVHSLGLYLYMTTMLYN